MGRPPGNGTPAFRFYSNEVAEMETIIQQHKAQVPSREVIEALAQKFSTSEQRSGKIKVQMKQVWNWFQNRRHALRGKVAKSPMNYSAPPVHRHDSTAVRNAPQAPQSVKVPVVQSRAKPVSDNSPMEFEAKSARDGAWYDVASFISHRSLETDDPDVLVRFAGFGSEEDEWVNVRKHVRPRSLPCESSECIAILPRDLILCFQEGKEQALYYDAHVIDSQRRRHDVRGCRCRFLVRYGHDQSEEIVPLRKVCRRPETDYRLLQLQAMNESGTTNPQMTSAEPPHMGKTQGLYPPSEPVQKPQKADGSTSQDGAPLAMETKAPSQAKNPEAVAGNVVVTSRVPSNNEAVTSGAAVESKRMDPPSEPVQKPLKAEGSTSQGDASVAMETEASDQTRKSEESAGDAVLTSTVPPSNELVTTGAGGDALVNSTVPPSNEVVTTDADIYHAVTVPTSDEVVTADAATESEATQEPQKPEGSVNQDDAPVAMEIEAQTRNPGANEGRLLLSDEVVTGAGIGNAATDCQKVYPQSEPTQKPQNPEGSVYQDDAPVDMETEVQTRNPETEAQTKNLEENEGTLLLGNEVGTTGAGTDIKTCGLSENMQDLQTT